MPAAMNTSSETCNEAKRRIEIVELAEELGYTPVRVSKRYYSLREHDSVRINIDEKLFYQNSQGRGGSVIDFEIAFSGRRYDDHTVDEGNHLRRAGYWAARGILERFGYYRSHGEHSQPRNTHYTPKPKTRTPRNDIPKDRNGLQDMDYKQDTRLAYDYLTAKRSIDGDIVNDFIQRGIVRVGADKRYPNIRKCVFYSPEGNYGIARMMNDSNPKYRVMNLSGSDEECGFMIDYDPSYRGKKTMVVTESVIDAMSVMSELKRKGEDLSLYKFLATAGTGKTERVLGYRLREHEEYIEQRGVNRGKVMSGGRVNENVDRIMLAFDNDDAGRKAFEQAQQILRDESFGGVIEDYTPPRVKDWNEFVQLPVEERNALLNMQSDTLTTEEIEDGLTFEERMIAYEEEMAALYDERMGYDLKSGEVYTEEEYLEKATEIRRSVDNADFVDEFDRSYFAAIANDRADQIEEVAYYGDIEEREIQEIEPQEEQEVVEPESQQEQQEKIEQEQETHEANVAIVAGAVSIVSEKNNERTELYAILREGVTALDIQNEIAAHRSMFGFDSASKRLNGKYIDKTILKDEYDSFVVGKNVAFIGKAVLDGNNTSVSSWAITEINNGKGGVAVSERVVGKNISTIFRDFHATTTRRAVNLNNLSEGDTVIHNGHRKEVLYNEKDSGYITLIDKESQSVRDGVPSTERIVDVVLSDDEIQRSSSSQFYFLSHGAEYYNDKDDERNRIIPSIYNPNKKTGVVSIHGVDLYGKDRDLNYILNSDTSVQDITSALERNSGNYDATVLALDTLGTRVIIEDDINKLRDSDNLTFSFDIDLNRDKMSYDMEVINEGKGGIAFDDRRDHVNVYRSEDNEIESSGELNPEETIVQGDIISYNGQKQEIIRFDPKGIVLKDLDAEAQGESIITNIDDLSDLELNGYGIIELASERRQVLPQEQQKTEQVQEPRDTPRNLSDIDTARPYIVCEWSESPMFEDGIAYRVSEFDAIMANANEKFARDRTAMIEQYGSWDNAYEAVREAEKNGNSLGIDLSAYHKTKFTIVYPDGRTLTERQDIGDAMGGVIDFLKGIHYDVTALQNDILRDTQNITNSVIEQNLHDFEVVDGVLVNYNGKDENVAIPDNVTEIGEGAFEGNRNIKNVTIPESVHKIDIYAFSSCRNLENVAIPDGVTEIRGGAFHACKSLEAIKLPNSITKIEEATFENCKNLKEISIPDGVTSIGKEAFEGCDSLTSVVIPESVTEIDVEAFAYCHNLTDVTIPNSVDRIANTAFQDTPYNEKRILESENTAKVSQSLLTGDELSSFTKEAVERTALLTQKDNMSYGDSVDLSLQNGLRMIAHPEQYKVFLRNIAVVPRNTMSLDNRLIIFNANPNATIAMTYEQWKGVGRQVQRGSHRFADVIAPSVQTDREIKRKTANELFSSLETQKAQGKREPTANWEKMGFTLKDNGSIATTLRGSPYKTFHSKSDFLQFMHQTMNHTLEKRDTIGVFDVSDTVALTNSSVLSNPISVSLDDSKASSLYGCLQDLAKSSGYSAISDNGTSNLSNKEACVKIISDLAKHTFDVGEPNVTASLEERTAYIQKAIQAEAVAYSIGQRFGIDISTPTFEYMPALTHNFNATEFAKTIEQAYKATNSLVNDLSAVLKEKGLSLDLTPLPEKLSEKEVKALSTKYMRDTAVPCREQAQGALQEMPDMVRSYGNNAAAKAILSQQYASFNNELHSVEQIYRGVSELNQAESRREQESALDKLSSAKSQIEYFQREDASRSEEFIKVAENLTGKLRSDYKKDPLSTLQGLARSDSNLSALSTMQLNYIANSPYISQGIARQLDKNPSEFAVHVAERAKIIPNIASKDGVFVEVKSCDSLFTKTPFMHEGTLCSPSVANLIIADSIRQTGEVMRQTKEKLPPVELRLTVFVPDKDNLVAHDVSMYIGRNDSKDLRTLIEHSNMPFKNKVLSSFAERPFASKIYIPDKSSSVHRESAQRVQSSIDTPRSLESRTPAQIASDYNKAVPINNDNGKESSQQAKTDAQTAPRKGGQSRA